jgi:hypothetical protein
VTTYARLTPVWMTVFLLTLALLNGKVQTVTVARVVD